MKKARTVIILFLFLFFLFPTVAHASEEDGLWQDFCELLPEVEAEDSEQLTENVGAVSIFSLIISLLSIPSFINLNATQNIVYICAFLEINVNVCLLLQDLIISIAFVILFVKLLSASYSIM